MKDDYDRLIRDAKLPEVGTMWRHKDGDTYEVIAHALGRFEFPQAVLWVPSVVYARNGMTFVRHIDDFRRSFTPARPTTMNEGGQ